MGDDKKEKTKIEDVAEKTGGLVGKGVKKGFGIGKSFLKSAENAIEEKKEDKK
jgi:hypothetical protein